MCEERGSRKFVQKNGEETLTAKNPYFIMRGLEPILIDMWLFGHFGMFTYGQ